MHERAVVFTGLLWLGAASLCEAQGPAEQVLPADKGAVGTPLRRPDNFPHFQLSNLHKGGGQLRPAEFTVSYNRDVEGAVGSSVILVANGANGRKEYSSWGGPFSPFADKTGTVSAEASFSPFAKQLGDQFEIWLESPMTFEGKTYRVKISNSVVVGSVGQLTLARNWNAEETQVIARWQKSIVPPPAPPAGHMVAVADTKLLPGMPVMAGWLGNWEPAEVINVRQDGFVLVKYKAELSQTLILRTRNWLSVSSTVLQTAATNPGKFQPSVKILPGGTLPVNDGLVPLAKDVKLVKGTPLQAEWAGKWSPVTVIKVLGDNRVKIRWDDWKGWPAEDKPREIFAISDETLKALKDPAEADKFAERVTESTTTFGGPAGAARKLQDYPIRIAIPKSAVKVTAETKLQEGTKLGCSWGQMWYDVTVLELNDDDTVRIHWEKFGDAWDGDISRDSLIIDKKVLAKLPEKAVTPAKKSSKEEKPAVTPKTAGDGEVDLILTSPGKNKFAVIKVVMEITGLEIKDAKELVENTPIQLKGGLSKADADKLLKKITTAGGTGEVKAP